MENSNITHKKKNGIYYTPDKLAEHLVSPLVTNGNISIFDPAYGDGALLRAAEKVFNDKVDTKNKLEFFGCDTNPVNGLLKRLPEANLLEKNFFQFSSHQKYNLILTNPPYIRRQNQKAEEIKEYREAFKEFEILNNQSDIWAYFIIKALSHLKKEGSIGAVLPWSFLQADYARPLREWLLNKFQSIKVLALNSPYFESAQERVLLLWLEGFGRKTTALNLAVSADLSKKYSFKSVRKKDWISNKVVPFHNETLEEIFIKLEEYGFERFRNYAETKIGIVTGANSFFIKPESEFVKLGANPTHLKPILTGAKELSDFLENGKQNLKRLVLLKSDNYKQYKSYIESGESLEYHLRAHSLNRDIWYSIQTGKIPDGFFPYRVGTIPFLVLNDPNIQSTNSIHRIYFKNLSKTEIKWVQVSMLSTYGQISLEVNAKNYGRGMLKIEPTALGETFVFKSKKGTVDKVSRQIKKLLINGEKNKAVEVATNFINNELGIDETFSNQTKKILDKIKTYKKR